MAVLVAERLEPTVDNVIRPLCFQGRVCNLRTVLSAKILQIWLTWPETNPQPVRVYFKINAVWQPWCRWLELPFNWNHHPKCWKCLCRQLALSFLQLGCAIENKTPSSCMWEERQVIYISDWEKMSLCFQQTVFEPATVESFWCSAQTPFECNAKILTWFGTIISFLGARKEGKNSSEQIVSEGLSQRHHSC